MFTSDGFDCSGYRTVSEFSDWRQFMQRREDISNNILINVLGTVDVL